MTLGLVCHLGFEASWPEGLALPLAPCGVTQAKAQLGRVPHFPQLYRDVVQLVQLCCCFPET